MIKVHVGTFTAVAAAIHAARAALLQSAQVPALKAAGQVLHGEIHKTMDHRCHTLAALAVLDHPYAKRHPTILIHQDRPYIVHRQSGVLLRALKHGVSGARDSYDVWLDRGVAPHAAFIVDGTKFMHQRDILWRTAQERRVQRLMMRAIVGVMGRGFRTQAMVRFSPTVNPSTGTRV